MAGAAGREMTGIGNSLTGVNSLLAYLAVGSFVVHMFFAENYGYFRDELYYIVSGTQHLSLGYVDFPPFIAYVAAFLNVFTGDSLLSIHVVPALVEAAVVFLAGMIARELGGGRRAQLLAATCTLLGLVFLAQGSLFSPDSFDQLWWSLLAYLVVRTVRRKEPKLWVAVGIVLGLGMLTKLTILFFAVALLVSFLVMPSCRRYLRSRWLVAGGLIAFAFLIPMVYWNFTNGWPMVQFYQEFRGDVGGGGPLVFLSSQLSLVSILGFPTALMGVYFYLRSDEAKELRALGLAYILLYIFMTVLNAKPYYLGPVYPMLFAGGALAIEKSGVSKRGVLRWFGSRPYVAALAIITILLVPIVMPVLPPATLVSTYGEATLSGANGGVASGETGPLPQNLGDRLGWDSMVSTIAQVYYSLPPGERGQACIFASNYGEASAVNFLGKGMGLPETISGHNSYYIWGPDSCTGAVLITVGVPLSSAQQSFRNVTLAATLSCSYCMDLENNVPVLVCTGPSFASVASIWPQVRQYD